MNVSSYLFDLRAKLLNDNNWKDIVLTRQWTSRIPQEAGVYILIGSKQIVYVGETGNLRGRMNDLLDSRHHSIRRTIGKNLFANIAGFVQATTKIKFPDQIETLVNKYITENLKISYLIVPLGRK